MVCFVRLLMGGIVMKCFRCHQAFKNDITIFFISLVSFIFSHIFFIRMDSDAFPSYTFVVYDTQARGHPGFYQDAKTRVSFLLLLKHNIGYYFPFFTFINTTI